MDSPVVTYKGITVTNLVQALVLITENRPQLQNRPVAQYEYGAFVGYRHESVLASTPEMAQRRVAAKRWLRMAGYGWLATALVAAEKRHAA